MFKLKKFKTKISSKFEKVQNLKIQQKSTEKIKSGVKKPARRRKYPKKEGKNPGLANGPAQSTPTLYGAPDRALYERGIGFTHSPSCNDG
jgi:hypothetical protein